MSNFNSKKARMLRSRNKTGTVDQTRSEMEEMNRSRGNSHWLCEDTAIQEALRYSEKRKEHEAQHGPVKVLWKDGKPV